MQNGHSQGSSGSYNVVFTTIFGKYDELRPPQVVDANFRYICFSDEERSVSPWETIVLPRQHIAPRRDSRTVKWLPHLYLPGAAVSLYHDAACYPKTLPTHLVENWLSSHDIAAYANPFRDCVYDEGATCIQYKADDPAVIRQQMDLYKDRSYPAHNGLAMTGIFLRRHTPAVAQFNESVWAMISRYSYRDQLSMDYVLWTMDMPYNRLPPASFWDTVERFPHNEGTKWSQWGEEWF